jgi:hypothetical protein
MQKGLNGLNNVIRCGGDMKKFFVSVGLIAVGTASLQAAYAPDWNSTSASMWSVSGTLRGFYDNNYETAPSGAQIGSFGFEVSPQVSLNVPLQQTELGMSFIYGLYYYQERENQGQNPIDQTAELDLWLDHAFSERWQMRVQDSFVSGQEPELIDPNTSVTTRINGNNVRNTGTITLHTDWTRQFSTELGYQNNFYDYEDSGATVNYATIPPAVNASLAGLMNRIEQNGWLNFQWQVQPETMVLVGGSFDLTDYTGNEPVATGYPYSNTIYYSNDRNNRSYIGYLGFKRTFLPNLTVSLEAGFQYTDSYNDSSSTPSLAPYGVLSAEYTYAPGSYVQVGFSESQNSTDIVQPDAQGQITLYQQSSTVYASVNHKLTPKLLGSVIGRWQHSVFYEGLYNNEASDYYSFGVNLSYHFTPHFSAEAGYNFDDVSSEIPGYNYTRSRVYLGVTAAY